MASLFAAFGIETHLLLAQLVNFGVLLWLPVNLTALGVDAKATSALLAKSAIYQGDGLIPTGMRRALTAVENTRFMGHGYDPTIEGLIGKQAGVLREGKTTAKEAAAALQKAATEQQKRYADRG